MPYRKHFAKKTKRAPRYKRRVYRRRPIQHYRRKNPLGNKLKATLKYVVVNADGSWIDQVVNGLTVDNYILRANGMYDPDYQIGGHQPIGFDQMMNMYHHFTVIGAKCKVTWANLSDQPIQCGISLLASPSLTTTNRSIENGQTILANIAPLGAGGSIKTLTYKFSSSKFFGRSSILSEDDFRGDASTDPVDQAYFHCWCRDIGNTVGDKNLKITATIEYIAVFTEPAHLPTS